VVGVAVPLELGFGTGSTVQLVPFQSSLTEPTAMHAVTELHETALNSP
jgi:hypothetical protein